MNIYERMQELAGIDEGEKDILHKLPLKDGKGFFIVAKRYGGGDKYKMYTTDKNGKMTYDWGSHPSEKGALKFAKNHGFIKE